jgi:hypothetical protein
MNTIKSVISALAAAVVSVGAFAQAPSTTDEAREAAHQALYEGARERAFGPPVLEDIFGGDYKDQWRNEARVANYYRFHRALQAYEAGARSTPIAVDSTDSAKEEAARVRADQELAGYVAYLKTSPAARVAHQQALSEQALMAAK